VRCAFGARFQRLADRRRNLVVADLTRRAGMRLVVKPVHAIAGEPPAPHTCGVRANVEFGRDLLIGQAVIALLVRPSAAARTMRARTASDCGAPCLRVRAVNACFSASSSTIATARPFAILAPHLAAHGRAVRAGDHEIRQRAPLQLGSALERPPLIARNPRLPAARLAPRPWSYLTCHIP
jgi:hypothetical protein